ncbi:hypothetical protein D3C86_1931930 [compost metagenome]
MSIKITTVVGEISETIEFSTFEEYAMYLGMKMFLESPTSLQVPSDANIEEMIESLAEAKKKGSVH